MRRGRNRLTGRVHHDSGRTHDGRPHESTVADVFTVVDGQVVRMQAYADPDDAFA